MGEWRKEVRLERSTRKARNTIIPIYSVWFVSVEKGGAVNSHEHKEFLKFNEAMIYALDKAFDNTAPIVIEKPWLRTNRYTKQPNREG